MLIPVYVRHCIDALELAGHAAYCVGGCVRDAMLGLVPHDYDLCTDATPEQMKQIFSGQRLVLAGEKHGTVAVVTDSGPVEITTFRTEGAYTDNRHPGWVTFVPRIEEDLARRDFTVNAMAYSPSRGFADPFCGQQDLHNKCLRAVGDPTLRFQEDSLRILRGVRFAVRFGLTPEHATLRAMEAQAPLMDNLARERVFEELCKLLPLLTAEELIRYRCILAQVIPELRPTIGFDQHSPHHAYDLYTHIAHVTAAVPGDLALRWAALLHDIGKIPTYTTDETGRGHFYGHAKAGAAMAEEVLRRLKAPTALRDQVVELIGQHMTRLEPDKKLLRRWLGKLGTDKVLALLALQEADMGSKGTGNREEMDQFPQLRAVLDDVLREEACLKVTDLNIRGSDLAALGFQGPGIGQCLAHLLEQVQNEQLPNRAEDLLAEAKKQLK